MQLYECEAPLEDAEVLPYTSCERENFEEKSWEIIKSSYLISRLSLLEFPLTWFITDECVNRII